MAATTDYHNATDSDANNTDTLNKTAIPNYGRSSFVRSASGRKLLKTNAHISICHPSLSRPFEAIFRTTTMPKPRKLSYCLQDRSNPSHSQVWDPWRVGGGNVTNTHLPCGYLTFSILLPFFYLVHIKHSLRHKHVDHATSTLLYPHVPYLYKLVSRVLCSLPSL